MTRFRNLTDDAVHAAALATAVATGTTTTLDVKRHLRDRGYWALQDEVSARLARLASSGDWSWWPVGAFRLYRVPTDPQARFWFIAN